MCYIRTVKKTAIAIVVLLLLLVGCNQDFSDSIVLSEKQLCDYEMLYGKNIDSVLESLDVTLSDFETSYPDEKTGEWVLKSKVDWENEQFYNVLLFTENNEIFSENNCNCRSDESSLYFAGNHFTAVVDRNKVVKLCQIVLENLMAYYGNPITPSISGSAERILRDSQEDVWDEMENGVWNKSIPAKTWTELWHIDETEISVYVQVSKGSPEVARLTVDYRLFVDYDVNVTK